MANYGIKESAKIAGIIKQFQNKEDYFSEIEDFLKSLTEEKYQILLDLVIYDLNKKGYVLKKKG